MARRRHQRGHLMVGLVAAVAILMILSAVAGQAWRDRLRREMEAEMMFRGQEIARAILRYKKAQGRLPNTLDELMEPGPKGEYFLRQKYEDPLVKDGKWGLLFQAPGGGVLDPNSPGLETETPSFGGTTRDPIDPQQALTPSLSGQQPTGLPIIGVRTLATERPFRVYKGQRDYALWTFTVLDLQPQLAGQTPGQPPATPPGQPPG